jgi:hypothetical protein
MRAHALGLLAAVWMLDATAAQDSRPNIALATPAQPASDRQPQRVLYAGQPDHARTQEFVAFFGDHFAKVGVVDVRSLSAETAEGWDVVVMDLPDDYAHAREVKLREGFDRPTVLVGMWPARFAEAANLKISDG